MRYRDITSNAAGRFRLPPSHPYLAEVVLDPADWCRFQRLFADDVAVRILGHDDPENDHMVVYTACASPETQRRLDDGWG